MSKVKGRNYRDENEDWPGVSKMGMYVYIFTVMRLFMIPAIGTS